MDECDINQLVNTIRSTRTDPFEFTLEIICDSEDAYRRLKSANVLTNQLICCLYHVEMEDIIANFYSDDDQMWQCTLKRPQVQDSNAEVWISNSQQHAALLNLRVPQQGSMNNDNVTRLNDKTHNDHAHGIVRGLAPPVQDRSSFDARDSISHLLQGMNIPTQIVETLQLPGQGFGLPSSFKVGHLAQASIALTALLASLLHSLRTKSDPLAVTVPLQHAVAEFKSERLYSIDGQPPVSSWGPIGGLHKTSDGYVRLHDNFPHHREGAKRLLSCSKDSDRAMVGQSIANWFAVDLESAAFQSNLVISALRNYQEWDLLPQARAIRDFPISITKIAKGSPGLSRDFMHSKEKCLTGLRVIEMSRVIAAPVAGKTLAVHGADVLWITSPNLPDQPALDRDMARGKRTVRLDINNPDDKAALLSLAVDADVFLQGYRPGSLSAKGLSTDVLAAKSRNGIICANMSAYGPDGPWSNNRGFDSLVQTCSGMNVSEAEHFGKGEPARATPCQALDHAGGYFLAAGIMAALYKRATNGGSYEVNVSLAGVMKYLRSLGQHQGDSGFSCADISCPADVEEQYMEYRKSSFGMMRSVRHSAHIDDIGVGWDIMPKPLGSDEPKWL